jgi:DNA invertase Pin-like site-specific DNA recombinase
MANRKSVYAYLRVSGAGQLNGHGFDRQLESIESFCKKAGCKIEEVFQEAVSGTTEETDRPAFGNMVTAIRDNGVDTIVVESLDRLAREYRIQEQLLIYLASKGINLIAANTGENVTQAVLDDPMKKALIQIQGIFAELDKSLLVRKLRKARERKREKQGKCEGRKGYQEFNPELLQVIRKLRRKPRSEGKRRMTFESVAERLNDMGYRAANGSEFSGNTVRGILHRQKRAA